MTANICVYKYTPQYKDLEPLYQKYQAQGFEILCQPFGIINRKKYSCKFCGETCGN